MSLSVIPRNIGYISKNSGQNALEISGAVDNIVEHGILKLKNNKFNGVEVIQVLTMSGMAFVLSMRQWQCNAGCPKMIYDLYVSRLCPCQCVYSESIGCLTLQIFFKAVSMSMRL